MGISVIAKEDVKHVDIDCMAMKCNQSLQVEEDRRVYWSIQMDEAFLFMQMIQKQKVDDCGEKLVAMQEVVIDSGVEVRFLAAKHVDGLNRQFYIRTGLIDSFIGAARELNDYGWMMRVEDGFRNRHMQSRLALDPVVFEQVFRCCVWECRGGGCHQTLYLDVCPPWLHFVRLLELTCLVVRLIFRFLIVTRGKRLIAERSI